MCGPARTSIFFGTHPWMNGVYDHTAPSDKAYFKLVKSTPSFIDDYWAAGYHTIGSGKLYHGRPYDKWDVYKPTNWYISGYLRKNPNADPATYDPAWISPYTGKPIGRDMPYTEIDFGPSGKTADHEPDGITTRWVQKQLEHIDQRPFVVGFGNYLPHEPWRIPKRFFDMHPLEDIVLPTVREDDLDDLPRYATEHIIDQLHQFRTIERHGLWKQAVQAYQAAITFADDRVGILLDTLAHSPFADDTIVVVISDHGFHLGEKMHIQKMTLWERATRVPFLLKVPGRFDHEQRFEPPISTMDLGPTLAELCDIPTRTPYVGKSLLPLIANPALADRRPPITTWLEGNHSVRRGPYRYIRYRTHETELYDHSVDPDEFTNIASDPAHRQLIAELDAFLPAD
jgi:arylsulfatase A-like enzyme